jgi:hypothetical protein
VSDPLGDRQRCSAGTRLLRHLSHIGAHVNARQRSDREARSQKDNTRQNSQSESVRETTIRVPCNLTLVFKSSFVWCRELGVDYLTLRVALCLSKAHEQTNTRFKSTLQFPTGGNFRQLAGAQLRHFGQHRPRFPAGQQEFQSVLRRQ